MKQEWKPNPKSQDQALKRGNISFNSCFSFKKKFNHSYYILNLNYSPLVMHIFNISKFGMVLISSNFLMLSTCQMYS